MYPGCLLTIPLQCSLRFSVSSVFVNYTIAVLLEILCTQGVCLLYHCSFPCDSVYPGCLLAILLQFPSRFCVSKVFVMCTIAVLLEILCIQRVC